MKKIFILAFGLVSLVSNAQKIIVDEKIEKNNFPFGMNFLNNNVFYLKSGKKVGAVKSINTITKYSLDSLPKKIIENEKMNIFFKTSDNSYQGTTHNGVGWSVDDKIFDKNGKVIKISKSESFDKIRSTNHKNCQYFILNDKSKEIDDIQEEDLILNVLTYKTNSKKEIKLKKPSFCLIDKNSLKGSKKIPFTVDFKETFFEIKTYLKYEKSNDIDFYITKYDYEGIILSDKKFTISIENQIISSFSGGGIDPDSGIFFMYDSKVDFGLMNYITDDNGNNFFYGLTGQKNNNKLINNEVKGYFIVKTDKNFNILWNKVYDIKYEEILENSSKIRINTSLNLVNNKLRFTLFKHKFDQYLYYSHINTETGEVSLENKIDFKINSMSQPEMLTTALPTFFYFKESPKLLFDINSMYFYNSNSKIKDYFKTLASSKNKISFNCHFNNKGIWLLETDNKDYYKVTYFNHE